MPVNVYKLKYVRKTRAREDVKLMNSPCTSAIVPTNNQLFVRPSVSRAAHNLLLNCTFHDSLCECVH